MNDKEKFSADFLKVFGMSDRLTWEQKQAKNFRWAERRAEMIDTLYPDTISKDYKARVEDNYRLLEGNPMQNYTKKAFDRARVDMKDLAAEGIDAPDLTLEHFDVITPMVKGLHGDQQRRKLKFVVTDSSLFTQNYIKDTEDQLLKNHFDQNLIVPARERAAIQYQIDNGIKDPFSLTPEERQKMSQAVNQSVETLIPRDVMNFMKNGSKGKLEKQGQAIAEYLVAQNKLKFQMDEAYFHSFANDAIIFKTEIVRKKVKTKWVDPINFNTGGGDDFFIDGNSWFKHIEYLTPPEILGRYSDQFTREDRKKFDELISIRGDNNPSKDRKFLLAVDFDGQMRLNKTNMLTKKGQREYGQLLDDYSGSDIKKYNDIRLAHIYWLSQAKMKLITRGYSDGEPVEEWYSEEYTFNPNNGDLEERVVWVPQYWQTTIIGSGEGAIFVDKKPVPCQYRDITDPFVIRSPFTGAYLNDMRGHGERRTDLDRAKPYIHMINFQMRSIKEKEATDIGRIMLMAVAAKPKGWSWGKLFATIRATRILPINTQQTGLTSNDLNFLKEINLDSMYDIVSRVNYLQYLIARVEDVLSASKARQGQVAASTSVTNNISNLNRSFAQTHSRSVWYDQIMERLIENMIYYGRRAAKKGNIFLRRAMDNLSIANIDINVDETDPALYNVKVISDEVDLQQLDMLKNFVLPYVQTNGLSGRYAAQIVYAASRGELVDIMSEAELEVQMNQAQAMQFEKMAAEEEREWQKAIAELKFNYDAQLAEINNAAKKDMAALQAMTIANGNDVNRNNENDYLEDSKEDRAAKREELFVKTELELQRINSDREYKLMELDTLSSLKEKELKQEKELREKEIKIKGRQAKKTK